MVLDDREVFDINRRRLDDEMRSKDHKSPEAFMYKSMCDGPPIMDLMLSHYHQTPYMKERFIVKFGLNNHPGGPEIAQILAYINAAERPEHEFQQPWIFKGKMTCLFSRSGPNNQNVPTRQWFQFEAAYSPIYRKGCILIQINESEPA